MRTALDTPYFILEDDDDTGLMMASEERPETLQRNLL